MCCVVISGAFQNLKIGTGIDVTKIVTGNLADPRFFENDFGGNKAFPGGPTCSFIGKEVLSFARWSEKG